MRQRNGFVSVVRDSGDAESAVWKVTGADVASIAFIPAGARDDLPSCGLTEADGELQAGIDALLAEGAEPPPTSFSGPRELLATLRERRHRGALILNEPTAYLDRNERIVQVAFRLSSARVGVGFVRRSTGAVWGVGAATDRSRYSVKVTERFARIDCWQRFGLGNANDFFGRHRGADVASLGWLAFSYFLHVDGGSSAWAASSYLPAVWCYRDYLRNYRRDLEQATADEVEAVLRAKPDVPTGTRWLCVDTSHGCVNRVA